MRPNMDILRELQATRERIDTRTRQERELVEV